MNQTASAMLRQNSPFVRRVIHDGWTEHYVTAGSADHLQQALASWGASLLSAEWFGPATAPRDLGLAPVAVIQGRGLDGYGGWQAHAISGRAPHWIRQDGRLVGAWLDDAQGRYCWLTDLRPADTGASREEQAGLVLRQIEHLLQPLDMDFSHVYRTWFYLDDILDWYGPFNRVRNEFFQCRNIFGGIMPASTGVGAANLSKAAVLARAAAMRPQAGGATLAAVRSPLQCSAYDYGSAFSRAVVLGQGRHRQLFVSGTASIEPGGRTVHLGDTRKQMDLTVEVVRAILGEVQMSWTDVAQAIGYYRRPEEIGLWAEFARSRSLGSLPIVLTQSDVCRDDLLFEIELIAQADG